MDFWKTDEQMALADLVDTFLANEWSSEHVRETEKGAGWSPDLWKALGGLDLLTLAVGGDGGPGSGIHELRIVCEALGRHLALVPYIWSSVFAASLLSGAERGAAREEALAGLTERSEVVSVGLARTEDVAALHDLQLVGGRRGEEHEVRIPHGVAADRVLLLSDAAVDGDDVTVPVLPIDASRLDAEPRSDLQAIARMDVGDLRGADRVLVDRRSYQRSVAALKIGIAALAVGGAARVEEIATTYARDRTQFGKPIGSFQAVAHRCVDIRTQRTANELLTDLACWQLENDGGEHALESAALAKASATKRYAEAASAALQIHGGHGFSEATDAQLYFRAARGLEVAWGPPDSEYGRVGFTAPAAPPGNLGAW